jgi:hypothetical protein
MELLTPEINLLNPGWICWLICDLNAQLHEDIDDFFTDEYALTLDIESIFSYSNEEQLLPFIASDMSSHAIEELIFGAMLYSVREGDFYLAIGYSSFEEFLEKYKFNTSAVERCVFLYEKIVLGNIPVDAFSRIPWWKVRSSVDYLNIDNWQTWRKLVLQDKSDEELATGINKQIAA